MVKTTRWWRACLAMVGVMTVAFAGSNTAQEKKAYEKHDTTALYNSLKEVIDTGAKIYNEQGDHAGCYRLFQGSLLTVRPFLAPDLQKKIDEGITSSENLRSYSERALKLRQIIGEVRAQMKPGGLSIAKDTKVEEKKVEEKKKPEKKKVIEEKKPVPPKEDTPPIVQDKKNEEKKKEEKKKVIAKPVPLKSDQGAISGKVTLQGEMIPGGYSVTLTSSAGKKFSSAIQKDGSFQLTTPLQVGEYRIAVEPISGEKLDGPAVPQRYRSETTSGLTVSVQAGAQVLILDLVK
jgi:hypothetical protein